METLAQVTFTVRELELLVEALGRAASRHESMSRWNPRGAKKHDDTAAAMRKLRKQLICGDNVEAA